MEGPTKYGKQITGNINTSTHPNKLSHKRKEEASRDYQ
jgi:hypothetical protein